jgi:mRNA interferase RelE/StbE
VPVYRVEWSSAAERQFGKLTPAVRARLWESVGELAENPRPPGCVKMTDYEKDAWRIRVGDYRVIYRIFDTRLLVLVLRVGHRRQVYLVH